MTSVADFCAWRRNQKPRWRVEAHAKVVDTRFSGQVDRWTTRPSGWRVDQEDDLEVRNLRRRVVNFSELIAARG